MVFAVDDDLIVLETAEEALKIAGYDVKTFVDGYHAIKAFTENPGDVEAVVLDLGLPGLGGREVFKQLRRVDPGVPILIITGYVKHEDLGFSSEAKGCSLLQKPFSLDDFSAAVKKLARTCGALHDTHRSADLD